MSSEVFITGITTRDAALVRSVPKSDFHNHACLGYHLDTLRSFANDPMPDPPATFARFDLFIDYLVDNLHPHLYSLEGFEFSIDSALKQAASDGVKVLEMSIDAQMIGVYKNVESLILALDRIRHANPDVTLRPEIGINRLWENEFLDKWVIPMIESGYFRSIDLYGDEMVGPPEQFRSVYKTARESDMILKAHAGEYRDAEFVRRSVEVLDLDEVQHGIAAAESIEVMSWLVERKTVLHVCPTSNVHLERVASMDHHPIKTLYDNGVAVTVNSDDIMVFGAGVSDEYQNLYNAGLFSAEELDGIRKFGMSLRS